jgi:hypothetical protein
VPETPLPTPRVIDDPRLADLAELRAEFRQRHGRALYGFSLLMTLGDSLWASALTHDALDQLADYADQLEQSGRAAAVLRGSVLAELRSSEPAVPADDVSRLAALSDMQVSAVALAGLAALPPVERATLVMADVERLSADDVSLCVGERHVVQLPTIRRRYAAAAAAALAGGASLTPEQPADALDLDEIRRAG